MQLRVGCQFVEGGRVLASFRARRHARAKQSALRRRRKPVGDAGHPRLATLTRVIQVRQVKALEVLADFRFGASPTQVGRRTMSVLCHGNPGSGLSPQRYPRCKSAHFSPIQVLSPAGTSFTVRRQSCAPSHRATPRLGLPCSATDRPLDAHRGLVLWLPQPKRQY